MLGDLEIEKFTPVGSERRDRALLVGTHQAAISSDVGRKDRGKSAFDLLLRHFGVLNAPGV
jgi:hypothetical protein